MTTAVVFQRDTVFAEHLREIDPLPVAELVLQDTKTGGPHFQGDTVQAVVRTAPTIHQVRYRQWREEQKLLIDTSRFIQPRFDPGLLNTERVVRDLKLPSREVRFVSTDWLTIALVVSLVLFTSVRHSFGKYLWNLFQSVLNYPAASRMFRERNLALLQGAFRLDLFFYIILAVFIFQLANWLLPYLPVSGVLLFLVSLACVIVYFFLKRTAYAFLGQLTEATAEAGEFLFNMGNYNKVLGISLFPIVALAAYAPVASPQLFLIAGLILAALFYLLLLFRGFSILIKKQFPIFYLFLYLCTLEFLPLLLILKMVTV